MRRANANRGEPRLVGLAAAVVVVAALYFARVIFIPLALAVLLSLPLIRVVSYLENLRLPRLLAIFLVIAMLGGVLASVVWFIYPQFGDFINQLPGYEIAVQQKIHVLKGSEQSIKNASQSISNLKNEITSTTTSPSGEPTVPPPPGSSSSHPMAVQVIPAGNPLDTFQNILGPLTSAGAVIVFVIFILLGREDLRNRLIRLMYGGRLHMVTQAMDEAMQRVNRYLFLQLVVNCAYGLIAGIALHFIGIPHASLWGFAAGILRFLPYIGAPLGALSPTLLGLAVFHGWSHALMAGGVFLVLEILVRNFVEPLLYAAHIGLSPLAILIAAVFWTLIWGFPGLVLSTPLTVCLVVVGHYVPSLAFLETILGNEEVLPPHAQFYQRLLAGDQNEAKQIAELYLKENSLEGLYSSVVVPALSLAEQDRHHDELDTEEETFIYQSTREIVEDLAEAAAENQQPDEGELFLPLPSFQLENGRSSQTDVLCIPAWDHADELVAILLAQLLEARGKRSESLAVAPPAELLSHVKEVNPAAVCISALPPFAMSRARDLYAKLRNQFPDLPVAVCLWHFEGDPQKASARLRLAPQHHFFSTLPEALVHFSVASPRSSEVTGSR